ncbi:hypothetical protein [Nitrobacter hamburgensis]|uniref:hypothetical protein n=1 Tax=Nitrobacter hamburgensis TaxID=912 RepID=UPI0012ED29A9|nr:hypothetical protein [Nitrobacter hamburgensis]
MLPQAMKIFEHGFGVACRVASGGRLSAFPGLWFRFCPTFRPLGAEGHDFGSRHWQDFVGKLIKIVSIWFCQFITLNPDQMNQAARWVLSGRVRIPASGKPQHSRRVFRGGIGAKQL